MRLYNVPKKKSGLPPYVRNVIARGRDGATRINYYFHRGDFRVRVPAPDDPSFADAYNAAFEAMETRVEFSEDWAHEDAAITNNKVDQYFMVRQRAAATRAKAGGRAFTLPKHWAADKYMEQKGRCALTGVKMRQARGLMDPFCPTIDRIDSTVGYTPENSQIVCLQVNLAKNNLTEADFIKLCRVVTTHSRKRMAHKP